MGVDKGLVRERYGRSLAGYDAEAAVQRAMARQLVREIRRHGGGGAECALEIGCGTGLLSRELARHLQLRTIVVNDLVEECAAGAAAAMRRLAGGAFSFRPGDIENLDLPRAAFDLVASNAAFHWLDDPARLLGRLAGALREGGLLAFTSFGPDNLREVAAVGGRGLRYRSIDDVAGLVERRYCILHRWERREVLRFSSPRRVLEHLRRTGANGLERAGWTRGALRAFEGEYRRRFGVGDEVTLTYHPLLFVARRKADRRAPHVRRSRSASAAAIPGTATS